MQSFNIFRELSVLEGSKDGKMISDHIKDVYCTQDYDHDCREGGRADSWPRWNIRGHLRW